MSMPSEMPGSEALAPVPRPDGLEAEDLPVVKDLQSRFLFPFVFERQKVEEVSAALRAETLATRSGEALPLWHCADPKRLYSEPHHFYKDELLDHVASFLFPEPGAKGCGYFKIADVVANKWFHG